MSFILLVMVVSAPGKSRPPPLGSGCNGLVLLASNYLTVFGRIVETKHPGTQVVIAPGAAQNFMKVGRSVRP
jgi:hypothetical protein